MRYIKQVSRFLWSINLALAVVLVVVAVALIAPRRPASDTANQTGARETRPVSANAGERSGTPVNEKLILARDIFAMGPSPSPGQPSGPVPQVASAKVEVKQELPFRLVGTVAADAGASYAVLERLDRKAQDLYRVGDVIADARIDRIEQSRVVIMKGNVREVLELAVTAGGSVSTPVPTVAQNPPAEPRHEDNLVKLVSESQREINARPSRSSMSRATQFLSKMKVSPNVVNGESNGLRLSGLGDSAMAQLVGLRDGDVVQTVNGHPVANRRKAAQVLEKARSLGKAQLELTRGTEKKSLTFHTSSW